MNKNVLNIVYIIFFVLLFLIIPVMFSNIMSNPTEEENYNTEIVYEIEPGITIDELKSKFRGKIKENEFSNGKWLYFEMALTSSGQIRAKIDKEKDIVLALYDDTENSPPLWNIEDPQYKKTISVEKDEFIFDNKAYKWNEIQEIKRSYKKRRDFFGFKTIIQGEMAYLHLKSGKTIRIYGRYLDEEEKKIDEEYVIMATHNWYKLVDFIERKIAEVKKLQK